MGGYLLLAGPSGLQLLRHWQARAKVAALTLIGLWLIGVPPVRALLTAVGFVVLSMIGLSWQIVSGAAVAICVVGLVCWSLGFNATMLTLG